MDIVKTGLLIVWVLCWWGRCCLFCLFFCLLLQMGSFSMQRGRPSMGLLNITTSWYRITMPPFILDVSNLSAPSFTLGWVLDLQIYQILCHYSSYINCLPPRRCRRVYSIDIKLLEQPIFLFYKYLHPTRCSWQIYLSDKCILHYSARIDWYSKANIGQVERATKKMHSTGPASALNPPSHLAC